MASLLLSAIKRNVANGAIALIFILLILSVYYYHATLFLPPCHIHAWTQSDRYAVALGFLANGFNLFLPQTYNLATVNGITSMDLPLPEYIVAIIMKLSGHTDPVIFRSFMLLFGLVGYGFYFRLITELTGSTFKGIVAVVFLFTLPVISYCQAGFIPSSFSFPALLISYYYLFRYETKRDINGFYLAVFFMTLAALVRIPFCIFLFSIALYKAGEYYFSKKIIAKELLAFGLSFAIILIYQLYKKHIELLYGTAFLNVFMPAPNFHDALKLATEVIKKWSNQIFTRGHEITLLLLFVPVVVSVWKNKKHSPLFRPVLSLAAINLAGGLFYFLLMERQFYDHEYYFIDCLYPAIVLIVFALLTAADTRIAFVKWVLPFAAVTLFVAAKESKQIQDEKYSYHEWDRGEVTRSNFEGSDTFLTGLGVPASAKMLVLDAYSTNAPLIMMKRKGYTVTNTTPDNIAEGLRKQFDFIVTQDIYFASDVWYNYPEIQYRLKRIGGNGKISVYRWGAADSLVTLHQLMGIDAETETLNAETDLKKNKKWDTGVANYDSSGRCFVVPEDCQFGPSYTRVIDSNENSSYLVEGSFIALPGPGNHFTIAMQIRDGDSSVLYKDYDVVFHNMEPAHYACVFKLPKTYKPGSALKCFVWNRYKTKFKIVEMKVTAYN